MSGPLPSGLPPKIEHARTRVSVGFKRVANAHGTYSAHAYPTSVYDNSLDLDEFRSYFSAKVLSKQDDDLVFEFVGVDAPIANALRRILLSELPTVAIENVFVHENSSIMPDEMLAHRLGLVPLNVDPRKFDMRATKDEPATFQNTLRLRLKARCSKNPAAPSDRIAPPEKLYTGSKVLSGSIKYVPFEGCDQVKELGLDEAPRALHDDIVLAKMRPPEKIHVELEAVKGIGKDHAKFSPVATASYRMLPEIAFKQPVRGRLAQELVDMCPAKVFDIEDGDIAMVSRPRDCTMCRECIRDPSWSERIELARKRDHFIYSVESTGALDPGMLVTEALSILSEKCDSVLKALNLAVEQRVGYIGESCEENKTGEDSSAGSSEENQDRDAAEECRIMTDA